jgi:D-beta-D-heptose 7-phosphate kinase/D-beta-D-heptose 1-phosphate adenosyltransferase
MQGRHKIMPRDIAMDQIENWRREGLHVGFTNGCYDIMHAGHAEMLNDCAAECDRLIVAVNSDDSVRRLKGETRPINSEIDRAMLIANLACVDLVIIFREDTPLELLKTMQPDILMKGADYTEDQVVGGDFIKSLGGRVALIPLKEGYSTSNIVEKIRTQ